MNVCGIKFVHYVFPKGRSVVIRYQVCDAPCLAVSVAGLCRFGYNVNFSYHKTTLLWRDHHEA